MSICLRAISKTRLWLPFLRPNTEQIPNNLRELAENTDFRTRLVGPSQHRTFKNALVTETLIKLDVKNPTADEFLSENSGHNLATKELSPTLRIVGSNPEQFPRRRGEKASEKVTFEATLDVTPCAHDPARPDGIDLSAFQLVKPEHMPHFVERRRKIRIPEADPFRLRKLLGETQNSRAHRSALTTVLLRSKEAKPWAIFDLLRNEVRRAID